MKKILLLCLMFVSIAGFAAADMVDFSTYNAGESIEGVLLNDFVTITSGNQDTMAVHNSNSPISYTTNNGNVLNGCLPKTEGFSDMKKSFSDYRIDFKEPVTEFSIKMFDYGDFNYYQTKNHKVVVRAFTADDVEVAVDDLTFKTKNKKKTGGTIVGIGPQKKVGDACAAKNGQPGRYTFSVLGDEISYVIIDFVVGTDPNVAFGELEYVKQTEDVPEFGAIATVFMIGLAGLIVFKKRQ